MAGMFNVPLTRHESGSVLPFQTRSRLRPRLIWRYSYSSFLKLMEKTSIGFFLG